MTKEMLLEMIKKAMEDYKIRSEVGIQLPEIYRGHVNIDHLRELCEGLCAEGRRTVACCAGLPIEFFNKAAETEMPGPNCIVVPLQRAGHNYAANEPCMITSEDWNKCVKLSGSTGNTLDRTLGNWRIATDEEVDRFATTVAPLLKMTIAI